MSAGVSTRPLPRPLAMNTVPARAACTRPGHAEQRIAAQLQRIAEVVVEAAQDHVHRLQAGERLQVDAAVAHGQVGAVDQREAPVPREERVLEVGLVVRTWASSTTTRGLAGRLGARCQQGLDRGVEEVA